MQASPRRSHGFSLVEITLALGIAAVALVSLLGLLGAATESNRSAGRDTVLVSMTGQVLSDLRAAQFDALWEAEPSAAGTVKPATGAGAAAPQPSLYFFTEEGTPVPRSEAANDPEVVFLCTVRKVPDLATRSANTGFFNLLRLELEFASPAVAAASATVTRHTVHASIARY